MNRIRVSLAKIVTVALCIALLLPCWGAFAAALARPNGDYYYVIQDGGTAKITNYIGDASKLTVPDAMDGHAVAAIGNKAFSECYKLTEITLPDSVTAIGNLAFSKCGNLTEITLPDSLTTIGDEAFSECDNLTEITLPDSVTAIGDLAFSKCDNLTEITLPDSLESIGINPFADSGVQSIHVSPFHPFLATIDGALISKPDKSLICYPPARTDTAYAVPEGTLVIGDEAFAFCMNLTEITLPDSVTAIGYDAFAECYSLTEITLPDSVTAIGHGAFAGCDNLTEITLPDSLTAIGDFAFDACENLTEITLPDSLESIGINPFSYSGVQSIHVSPDHPFLATIGGALISKQDKRLIYYPSNRTNTAYAVPEGILVIDDWAFSWCENLTEITLPDSLTTIGYEAFVTCVNLTEITLPDSLTTIGDDAFFFCINLNSIIVGQDSYAMEYCVANDLPYSVRTE